ncbi:MAG: redoxin domain-containing protein [Betaproteobacteria bacterium]|nr:MAG: redoxin domain-containing protein [Betaproteobacteria bacterium]
MTPRRRDFLILGGVAAGAALIGGVTGALVLQSRSGAAELLAASYPDLSGQTRRLTEWRGKALLVNFWASWCAPCREEIPLLNAAQQQHSSAGLQVVGIGVDNAVNIGEFTKKVPIAYPVLIADAAGIPLMRELGNSAGGLPFTVLLDRQGRLAGHKLGAYSGPELQSALAALLR